MNNQQKYTDAQYLSAGESYFEGDDLTSHHTYQIVKTRKQHDCVGVTHKGNKDIPCGSKVLCEKAIHVDVGRVSCYVCLPCLNEWCADLYMEEL